MVRLVQRLKRSLMVCCLLGMLVWLVGCGGGGGVEVSSAPSSFDDTTLAGDLLATQMAALHHALPSRWQQIGSSSVNLQACAGWKLGGAGLSANASSPAFVYRRRLGLRVSTLMYADLPAARRALAAIASRATRSCVASQLSAGLRRSHYLLGRPQSSVSVLAGTGSEARSLMVRTPASSGARHSLWRYEAIAVRQGRRIDVLATTSTAPESTSSKRLAAALSRVTAVAQRYLQTGQVGAAGSTSG